MCLLGMVYGYLVDRGDCSEMKMHIWHFNLAREKGKRSMVRRARARAFAWRPGFKLWNNHNSWPFDRLLPDTDESCHVPAKWLLRSRSMVARYVDGGRVAQWPMAMNAVGG